MIESAQFSGIDFEEIKKTLSAAKNDEALFEAVVNAPFKYRVETSLLSLGIIVLLLVNKENGTIDRIALTDNELAARTKHRSVKKFEDIRIPADHDENIIAKAIRTQQPQGTGDWKYLFMPDMSEEAARFNQADGGIGYSAVYPLIGARDGGALIFSYFQYPAKIGKPQEEFMSKYSQLVTESL